ncbi:Flagellar basal-body rod protein FlgF [Liberibacter crescens BT-1]|uniref:Flagellar basal-body rod protein FlgF n=1 Tax=Liberibacter crescens (strain BT-1) TaxID=1215343 RepID=L0EVW2_LIBCB|nr:DUF1217 domain-containing protein [Liberibacter crescens]AGA64813.1 Flagellar basal-body rod protein FlgF [Liberibacter crescens BT-1]
MTYTHMRYHALENKLKLNVLSKVSNTPRVADDRKYYQENIRKISSVDQFMADNRLYAYAMKAYGLEDMSYAKALMRKALESDLADSKSFVNTLHDSRYREFAKAFNLSSPQKSLQTKTQEEDVISRYLKSYSKEEHREAFETQYFKNNIHKIETVDQLLNNKRLRHYILKAFGIDQQHISHSFLRKVLICDPHDPESFVHSLKKDAWIKLANAFHFEEDGKTAKNGLLTEKQQETITENYLLETSSFLTKKIVPLDQSYYKAKIGSVSSVTHLVKDKRLFRIIKTALGFDSTMTPSEFVTITTDKELAKGSGVSQVTDFFNINAYGQEKNGKEIQSVEQTFKLLELYEKHYHNHRNKIIKDSIKNYKKTLQNIVSIKDLSYAGFKSGTTVKDKKIQQPIEMILRAFDIKAEELSKKEFHSLLASDILDPHSDVNRSRDQRFIQLNRAFNFDSNGNASSPFQALSEKTIQDYRDSYIKNKTRFLTQLERKKNEKDLNPEITYFEENIRKIHHPDDFTADKRLVHFMLEAKGIKPDTVTENLLKETFTSYFNTPDNFIHTSNDYRFMEIVASFHFDANKKLSRNSAHQIQSPENIMKTMHLHTHQILEEEEGKKDINRRLALYFERKAPTITNIYDFLSDKALYQVISKTLGLSSYFRSGDIDKQAATLKKSINIKDFQDPEKLKNFIKRFNSATNSENSVLIPGFNSSIKNSGIFSLIQSLPLS